MNPLAVVLGIFVIFALVLIVFAVKGSRKESKSVEKPVVGSLRRKTPSAKKDFSKGYDPLDDSPLVEPVDLTINHPVEGKITLKVNRWNAKKYLKHGPSAFPKRRRDSYSGSSSWNRYYVSYPSRSGGEFTLLDYVILYHLFLSPNHGHFYEPSVVDARGYFDGVERDFSHSDYNERDLANQTVPDVSTVHDDQSPYERMENREDAPVIVDPFTEEKTIIPSDDEAPNAFGASEEHSSRDEVTASDIPSDDQSSSGTSY